MKVKELKAILDSLDENIEIVMSSDGEGNEYSPLAALEVGMYEATSTWCGYVYSEEDAQHDDFEYIPNAIVLYPTN